MGSDVLTAPAVANGSGGLPANALIAFLTPDPAIRPRHRAFLPDPAQVAHARRFARAVVGQCAEDGSSPLCYETMQIFSASFGAEAGNVALKVLAAGGMYLGGGIAPKALRTLEGGAFMQAFLDKGRLSPVLESIPVRIILDDTCALLGAAAYAERKASEVSGHSERAASA